MSTRLDSVQIKRYTKRMIFGGARYLGINTLAREMRRKRLLVLCYHGVISDKHPEEPYRTRNAVSLREFREQLTALSRFFTPVSAIDVLKSLYEAVPLPTFPVLVTFDDGFRNNLTCAAKELEQQGIPGLINVATGYIGQEHRLLWTQEIDERILAWKRKTLPMPENRQDASIPVAPSARVELSRFVVNLCKNISDSERLKYLNRLRTEPLPIGEDWYRELYEFLNWDEVRTLSRRGFAIGSHTVEHSILTQLPREHLTDEIYGSKAIIEHELGKECYAIAYPNGGVRDYSSEVVSIVKKAGYKMGLILVGKSNKRPPSPWVIDRVYIPGGLSKNEFLARITGLSALIHFNRR